MDRRLLGLILLLVSIVFFSRSLKATDWISCKDQPIDIDKVCIFYDAWNKEIMLGRPRDYLEFKYYYENTAVITHWVEAPTPPDINAEASKT